MSQRGPTSICFWSLCETRHLFSASAKIHLVSVGNKEWYAKTLPHKCSPAFIVSFKYTFHVSTKQTILRLHWPYIFVLNKFSSFSFPLFFSSAKRYYPSFPSLFFFSSADQIFSFLFLFLLTYLISKLWSLDTWKKHLITHFKLKRKNHHF